MNYFSIDNAKQLFLYDKIMESLLVYEKLLETEDTYTQLWRELAIAKTWDTSCINRIKNIINSLTDDIRSLAATFYLSVSYLLQKPISNEFDHYITDKHICQATIIKSLIKNEFIPIDIKKLYNIDIGLPETYKLYFDTYKSMYTEEENIIIDRFLEDQICPILIEKQHTLDILLDSVKDLPDEPLVHLGCCLDCEAKCCIDGVYLDEDDADKLKQFVKQYKNEFKDIPEDFIIQVPSMYEGMPDEIKTIAVPHEYKCTDFPEHFPHTKCIFVDDDGLCRIQKVAIEYNLQPWHAKPKVCWAFPMEDIRYNILSAPPKNISEDIYKDEGGYISCLSCCKHHVDGKSWKLNNLLAIEYFLLLNRLKGE